MGVTNAKLACNSFEAHISHLVHISGDEMLGRNIFKLKDIWAERYLSWKIFMSMDMYVERYWNKRVWVEQYLCRKIFVSIDICMLKDIGRNTWLHRQWLFQHNQVPCGQNCSPSNKNQVNISCILTCCDMIISFAWNYYYEFNLAPECSNTARLVKVLNNHYLFRKIYDTL